MGHHFKLFLTHFHEDLYLNNFKNVAIYKSFKLNMIWYFFKYDIFQLDFLTLSVINLQSVMCQSFKNIG